MTDSPMQSSIPGAAVAARAAGQPRPLFCYLYRTYIDAFGSGNMLELVIDMGFHVMTRRWISTAEQIDRHLIRTKWLHALVGHNPQQPEETRLLTAADGEAESAGNTDRFPAGPPQLWRFPARLYGIVDGDTLDAEIEIGFGITVQHRLRLAGIQAPEWTRSRTVAGEPGYEAWRYVYQRLRANRFRAQIVSSRHGKWRRWIAEVYLADSDRSLSQELLDAGHALPWDGRSSCPSGLSRMIVELPDRTRRRLGEVSAAEDAAPGQVAGRIVARHLDSDYPRQSDQSSRT
ncbi:MAG: hypothetical protein EA404_14345 [Spirochaetaceae bacterium]|nr:MAG: hypothetical protein EA404_14345 [Spirochaetaceae bacterium]